MIKQWVTVIAALVCCFGTRVGFTASDDNFYKGKTIRLIVAFSAGGGYDAYSRTIGRHLNKYIPGNPAIVVENMTGAGGIIHANYMYQAKPDALIIGNNAGGLILQQIMGAKGIEFDGKKFGVLWRSRIGSPRLHAQQSERRHFDGKMVCGKRAGEVRRRRPRRRSVRQRTSAASRARSADQSHRWLQRHRGHSPRGGKRRTCRRLLCLGVV